MLKWIFFLSFFFLFLLFCFCRRTHIHNRIREKPNKYKNNRSSWYSYLSRISVTKRSRRIRLICDFHLKRAKENEKKVKRVRWVTRKEGKILRSVFILGNQWKKNASSFSFSFYCTTICHVVTRVCFFFLCFFLLLRRQINGKEW